MSKVEIKAKIGGQALIEGIMMKSPEKGVMAVRKKDGSIYVEEWEEKEKKWYNKALFIRGCVNFVQQLREGWKCMNRSAEISGSLEVEDEEKTKFDRWAEKHFSEKTIDAISGVLVFLMVAALLAVFFFVPSFLFGLLEDAVKKDISMWKAAFEGVLKLALFVGYMALVAQIKDIKRTYEYHGAEHKTIACVEAGKELTVENVRPMTRFHPRCGTSFIIITFLVSILLFSLVPLEPGEWLGIENKALSALLRVLIKLPFLPIVAGISYELIKLAGSHRNFITIIISAPGLAMQRLTTREPDDRQIEVAIEAVRPTIEKVSENGA